MTTRSERGSQILEFALILPLLLLLLLGTIDIGWVLHKQIQIDNAVRAAARVGALGSDNTIVAYQVHESCTFTIQNDQITIEVFTTSGDEVDNTDRTPGNILVIKVDLDNLQPIVPIPLTGGITLHSTAEYMIE